MTTPLDTAHGAMDANPDDEAARRRFYERLMESELFLVLQTEPAGERIDPLILPVESERYVLAFDRIERMAEFADKPMPYLALSGRRLARLIGGQGLGIGVNLGVAPSSILVPVSAVDWLAAAVQTQTAEVQAQLTGLTAPYGLSEAFLDALDGKLAVAAGMAQGAYLAGTEFDDGSTGLLLGFVDALAAAEPALREIAAEAVNFSAQPVLLDVAFLTARDPVAAQLARVGLRFDMPEPVAAPAYTPTAPGLDPAKPPKLR